MFTKILSREENASRKFRQRPLSRGAYPQTMQKLATALGVAPEELLHGESSQL
jgi:hypothetical protein